MTQQPVWKQVAQLGDVNPIEHGGYFVYTDETGVYDAEAELLLSPDDDNGTWQVYRFILEPCTYVDGVLAKDYLEEIGWFSGEPKEADYIL